MGADNGATETAEVFDLDALRRDDAPTPFVFTAGEDRFTLGHPSDLDSDALTQLEQAEPSQVMRILLGDQWDSFRAHKVPLWKVQLLAEAWAKHHGLDLGESEASPPSSAPTAEPSRPTSVITTVSGSQTSRPGG